MLRLNYFPCYEFQWIYFVLSENMHDHHTDISQNPNQYTPWWFCTNDVIIYEACVASLPEKNEIQDIFWSATYDTKIENNKVQMNVKVKYTNYLTCTKLFYDSHIITYNAAIVLPPCGCAFYESSECVMIASGNGLMPVVRHYLNRRWPIVYIQ